MMEQDEQRVEGNQTNIGEMHGDVGQVGNRVETGGGAVVGQGVQAGNDFVGRDKITINVSSLEEAERPEDLWQELHPAEWEPAMSQPIPAGPFLMGAEEEAGVPPAETPAFEVALPAYRIGLTPVTNQQYAYYLRQTDRPAPAAWEGREPPPDRALLPVVGVSWYEARAYCEWLHEKTGRPYTLPDEAQWEKAARGSEGRIFPWGNEWEEGRHCNEEAEHLTPVDQYETGKSPYGCLDMVGNAREWTLSLWGEKRRETAFPYPWQPDDGRQDLDAHSQVRRVARGGAPLTLLRGQVILRASRRGSELPGRCGLTDNPIGFRVVLNLEEAHGNPA